MSVLKVYRPQRGGVLGYLAVCLATLVLGLLKYGSWTLPWTHAVLFGIVALGGAYAFLFSMRPWVYLYDLHLEIHPRLAKFVKDHLGFSLYAPTVVYYRQIGGLRRYSSRVWTFGGLIIIKEAATGRRTEHGIPYSGVENYADLEAELVRRAPPGCDLHSLDVLGHRGPF